ncbi:hypothetical protein, partial [Lacticaseibacillus nasuensis]|uniref:hypothetical protein n=1 Tax=Lacticaseibacillus nasuensis TaxID=944671 RepID=UPI001CDAE885
IVDRIMLIMKNMGRLICPLERPQQNKKTDDLEKNVDYLISHINELHRETTQSINNLETNLEKDFKDKTESLPTKDWSRILLQPKL